MGASQPLGAASGPAALPAPKALLFDWDNTLVDTWSVIHHALAVTFEAFGRTPWTLEETRQRVRASARDAFPELFGEDAMRLKRGEIALLVRCQKVA